MSERSKVVILGGGFAGIQCARRLRRRLPRDQWDVVLFNRENHMVFHPMLAEVAGGSLNPDCVAAPLRQMLPGVRCRTEELRAIDLEKKEVEFLAHDGRADRIGYDRLVVAAGAAVNLSMVPGMADHAFALKTVGDAVQLRAHVMQQLEKAEVCSDPAQRKFYLSFVVVGGGFSGVEAAGEINDLARGSRRFFANIRAEDIQVTIIHGRDQLLPEIGEKLREFTRAKMEKAGIDVVLNSKVVQATARGVVLGDGRVVAGATIVCTIGTTPTAVVQGLDTPKEKGRIVTEADMRLAGRRHEWAVGDCALIVNADDGKPSPPTGQFAERQGRQVADNILRDLAGRPTRPFSFRPVGQLCAIGGHSAVAEIFGIRISGFLAWFLWRSVYLFKLPTFARKAKVGFDWAWQLVFSRDLSHIRTDTTARVSHAWYRAGDFIFREGDPASDFFVLERGEVEVVRCKPGTDGECETLAVLGPGDFFGEMALLTNRPRNAAVRARTDVEVVVMGRHVFDQLSESLSPLRDLLTQAVARRQGTRWASRPEIQRQLENTPVSRFVEPLPPLIDPSMSFGEVLLVFRDRRLDFACVAEKDRLVGVLTRSDFLRAFENQCDADTPVREVMRSGPVSVAESESALLAAYTMREHGLKWLPVVKDAATKELAGIVQAQTMLSAVLEDGQRSRTTR